MSERENEMSERMSFRPLTVPTAHEYVLDRIRRAIQLSELLPGERLPSERDLAASMQVSRVPIREALRVLQSEGVLATRRGKGGGTVVLPDAASAIFAQENRDDRSRRIREVGEVRLALEPMAAQLAAARASSDQLAQMHRFQEDLQTSDDIDSFRRADSGFHLAIAVAGGNDLLRRAIEDARSSMFSVLDARGFTIVHSTSWHAHGIVLTAIEGGRAQAASEAMAAHLREAHAEIAAALAQHDQDPSRAS